MIHVEEQERQDLIEISDNRKNILSLIRPPFSPKISGWTTDGYFGTYEIKFVYVEPERVTVPII